jgi:hypothetical protein
MTPLTSLSLRLVVLLLVLGLTVLGLAWFLPYCRSRWVRLVLSWLLALFLGGLTLHAAWTYWDEPARVDGNDGHTSIDFAAQWLMGRMLLEGHGSRLYDHDCQRDVLDAHFPLSDQAPSAQRSDADKLLGIIDALSDHGGPLYPPTHALLMAPLTCLRPQTAYRVMQVLNVLLAYVCGLFIAGLSRGRLWWPLASSFVLFFPGFFGSAHLGQNAGMSLTVLLAGWWLLDRGQPAAGGAVWALLAAKPVWAVAFFPVLLLTRRWSAAVSMAVVSAVLVLATLPLVGYERWFEWVAIGRSAGKEYERSPAWIWLSHDLANIPNRWLLEFPSDGTSVSPYGSLPAILGHALWLSVTGTTLLVGLGLWRRDTPLTGPGAAFVLLGAWMSCYHFMYYDALLAAFGVAVLFAAPGYSFRPGFSYRNWESRAWDLVPLALLATVFVFSGLTAHRFKWEPPQDFVDRFGNKAHWLPVPTVGFLLLWLWCGVRWFGVAAELRSAGKDGEAELRRHA